MKKFFLIFFLFSISLFSFSQASASCTGGIVPCGTEGCPCTFCHIFELIHNIINFLLIPCDFNHNLPLIPLIAVLMLIIGGFYLLTAAGDPERFSKGKKIITAVVVGIVICFLAWVFLNTFFVKIEVADWSDIGIDLKKWYEFKCN